MKKKISKIAITVSFLLAFTNPVIADEKSGLRLYHLKIKKADLKDACNLHSCVDNRLRAARLPARQLAHSPHPAAGYLSPSYGFLL